MEYEARERRRRKDERAGSEEAPAPSVVLALQASAGNHAVTQLLQRKVLVPGKKKGSTKALTSRDEVLNEVFDVIGKKQHGELQALLDSDPEAGQALDAFLTHKDEILLKEPSSYMKLMQRLVTDAAAIRQRDEEQKKKEPKSEQDDTSAIVPSKPLKATIDRGAVNELYALCEPLYPKDKSAAERQKTAIVKAIQALKRTVKKLGPPECLQIFGHLGSFEITEVCQRAGAGQALSQLENALRSEMSGEERTPATFVFKELKTKLPWLTSEHFNAIFSERSGHHGAHTTSANITLTDVMHGWGEIIECAPSIDIVNVSGMSCLKTLGVASKDPHLVGFTLLHKIVAGNIRRYKLATIQRCMQRLDVLLPQMLDHEQVSPEAEEGIRMSLGSVIQKMNSKHLVRDLRQLEMLLAYLQTHHEAVCSDFAFSGVGWEFDIEITDDEGPFILEVEGLPGSYKDPLVIASYLRERHALKLREAQSALGSGIEVRLAVPADVPPAVLRELRAIIAIAGAPSPNGAPSPKGDDGGKDDDGD
jgi:hypothetical protein